MDNEKYPILNLPGVALRLRKTGPKPEVWDALRAKWLVLTPEEWVRQHFIAYLVHDRGMSPARIVQEKSLEVNGLRRRADIVVYSGRGEPQLIVECKAPNIKVTQEVFDQVAQYNIRLGVPYLVVTNGLEHYCSQVDLAAKSYRFIPEIPRL